MKEERNKKNLPIFGDKLYQQRARVVLPILIRQAFAATPIYYSALAQEAQIPYPRNLNYVLGCIGKTIECLNELNKTEIPPIQCLVINKNTKLPGEGIGWFLNKEDRFTQSSFAKLSRKQRREIVQAELQKIYTYDAWNELLAELELLPITNDFQNLCNLSTKTHLSSSEGKEHLALKNYIAQNPSIVGMKKTGKTEFSLPSGDKLDVSFDEKNHWLAVEVKPSTSNKADLVRGIFQCIKYQAVMEAVLISENKAPNVETLLILGGEMPVDLISLANTLGVSFKENIAPN